MILQWSVLQHGSPVHHLVYGLCWNCSFRAPFLQHNLAISFWGLLAVHYTKYFSYWEIWAVSSIKLVTRRALLACSPWSSQHKIIIENTRKRSYSASWTEFSLKIQSFLFARQGQAWNSAWEMIICANLISLWNILKFVTMLNSPTKIVTTSMLWYCKAYTCEVLRIKLVTI